ncbi:hypothetical protein MRX96_012396 [Rhipicephalus microplus]
MKRIRMDKRSRAKSQSRVSTLSVCSWTPEDSVEPLRHHSMTANASDDDCLTFHGYSGSTRRRMLPKGLNTVGIFRVNGSKRRVRQLREEFDSCQTCTGLFYTHSVFKRHPAALLKFHNVIAENSVDKKSSTGESLPGIKMDAHNLATMAVEHGEVILVVRQLIENYEELFRVSTEDLDSLYKRLLVDSPEDLEILLRRRFHCAFG